MRLLSQLINRLTLSAPLLCPACPPACVPPHHRSHREQVGMVAALLQVHHDVEQGHLVASTFGVQSLKVPGQYELVIFPAG